MSKPERLRLRADTAANWTAANPVLGLHEPARETDTGKLKVGDGVTAWADLPAFLDETALNAAYAGLGLRGARVHTSLSASQTIASGGWTPVTFDAEKFDSDAFHAPGTTLLTIPVGSAPRKYLILATISFAANVTGTRHISFLRNGGLERLATQSINALSSASFRSRVSTMEVVELQDGDTIAVEGYQDSGVGLDVTGVPGETWCALIDLGT